LTTSIAGRVDNELSEVRFTRRDGTCFQGESAPPCPALRDGLDHRRVIRDVTEVKERADELLRFRAAMEISGDGIGLVDRASMRYVDVNQTFCDLLGYTRTEMLGKTPMDLFGVPRKDVEDDFDAIIADKGAIRPGSTATSSTRMAS
jgi:PAS domain-containing protein